MTKKKLINSLLTLSLVLSSIMPAFAADAKVLFEVDCDTLNKDTQVGFQSDSADPANGPEIIAYEFTMVLAPVSGSTLADLANAKFEPNAAFTNMIVAQNTSKDVGQTRELKIAGGFTQQQGVSDAQELLIITGVTQKPYKITVQDGKLFPKDGGDNIYSNAAPKKTFTADPSACSSQTSTTPDPTATPGTENVAIENFSFIPDAITVEKGTRVLWTNNDSADHTVTSIGSGPLKSPTLSTGETYAATFNEVGTFEYQCTIHPSMRARVIVTEKQSGTGTADTGSTTTSSTSSTGVNIAISSDKDQANPGDEVVVTAIISNLDGSIDWSQTAGTRIQPNIANESQPDNTTKSTLTFQMPTPATDITLRVKVKDTTETITIAGTDAATAGAAPTEGSEVTPTEASTQSLQERLQERREQQQSEANPTQPSGTIHGAAGTTLTRSGPEHTTALVLLSVGLVYLLRRKKQGLTELA